jgi:hypothetical protein
MKMHDFPVVGNLLGGLFGETSPEEDAHVKALKEAAAKYEAMKPYMSQGLMNSLGQQLSLTQPMNNMLGQMGGQPFDYSKLLQNPIVKYR